MKILIKNGRILDPGTGRDGICDILVKGDKIEKVGQNLAEGEADQILDASGCYVMPGLIDLHVHLREPGQEHKETVETGARAGARGGFTTILAMPNTKPAADCGEILRYVQEKATTAPITVLQAGAITKGQRGEELADLEEMARSGVPAFSEDGFSVMDAGLYRRAMEISARYNIPILAHCEDKSLAGKGVMNDDANAARLGFSGICNSAEDVIIARDIILARETGARLHICHCSTKGSAAILAEAKKRGCQVTAEVCPHHFTLTSDEIREPYPSYKMNPPLRTREDLEALRQGLKDEIFDVIATDHAPHHEEEKRSSMEEAPFGIVGLETAVSLTVTELVHKGVLTPMQMAQKMSYHPARILGLDRGTLMEGKAADITIIDPEEEYVIRPEDFVSKGRNTPFGGRKVKGMVKFTICGGRVVWDFRQGN